MAGSVNRSAYPYDDMNIFERIFCSRDLQKVQGRYLWHQQLEDIYTNQYRNNTNRKEHKHRNNLPVDRVEDKHE